MSVPAFGRAGNIIAGTIAGFPLHIYESGQDGQRRLAQDDSNRFLWGVGGPRSKNNDRPLGPNPEVPAFVFWKVVATHKFWRENVYLFVVSDNARRTLELWPIDPVRVRVGRLADGRKIFEVDGKEAYLDYLHGGEIVHVVGDSEDGLVGVGPLQRYADTFETAISTEQYASRQFSNNTNPSGILKTDQQLTPDRAEELLARWEARHAGGVNAGRPAVLSNGLEWQTIQFNPEETQMLESRKFGVFLMEILSGVPPHLLGDVERSTSWGSGIEEQSRNFLTYTLSNHYIPIEQTITMAFLPKDRFALFNPDAILRPDTFKRAQVHEIMIRSRMATPNERRAYENMEPIEGGDELAAPPNASLPAPTERRSTEEGE
ncbi:MAG TPA: phage portal protein [Opitutus sp.]|nr:phage portal protein [Opitutus sp.]